MESSATQLSRLVTPTDYQSAGRGHVFPSATSLQWFMRVHRRELVQRGAVVKIAGRTLIDGERMDAAALAVGAAAVAEAA